MSTLTIVGVSLAVASLAVLVLAVRDCLRRPDLPGLRYGARGAPGSWVRAAWLLVLVGGWTAGAAGVDLAGAREIRPAGDAGAGPAAPEATARTTVSVPFYTRSWGGETLPGGGGTVSVREEAVTLPWTFLLALLLYWILAVRWPTAEAAAERVTRPTAGRPGTR